MTPIRMLAAAALLTLAGAAPALAGCDDLYIVVTQNGDGNNAQIIVNCIADEPIYVPPPPPLANACALATSWGEPDYGWVRPLSFEETGWLLEGEWCPADGPFGGIAVIY